LAYGLFSNLVDVGYSFGALKKNSFCDGQQPYIVTPEKGDSHVTRSAARMD